MEATQSTPTRLLFKREHAVANRRWAYIVLLLTGHGIVARLGMVSCVQCIQRPLSGCAAVHEDCRRVDELLTHSRVVYHPRPQCLGLSMWMLDSASRWANEVGIVDRPRISWPGAQPSPHQEDSASWKVFEVLHVLSHASRSVLSRYPGRLGTVDSPSTPPLPATINIGGPTAHTPKTLQIRLSGVCLTNRTPSPRTPNPEQA